MSLNTFRSQVLSNSHGEERVEVNQRLLIDKILARYSAEFVVYRELMQNSDDAKSSSIQIIFETPINKKSDDKITRILFKNNGFAFRPEDWNRLKKIAEGNPDEQKIGAFGVGFYSLFSMCEEPFVSSGGEGMAFFWQGNQLFTKQGPTSDKDNIWTTFLMDMREPIEFPNVEKFARFMANSLGFTGNLEEVFVYFNDTLVIHLSKKMQEPQLMNIAPGFDKSSPQKMFRLTSVDVRLVQLYIKKLLVPTNINERQLRSTNFQTEEASVFLKIASGNLNVNVTNEDSAEMERTTKKKPPSKTAIQMIFTGFDEHQQSSGETGDNNSPVFEDLLPYPEQGKIYIGFQTHQTTGCCSHLAARVIPTVERESIDLVEKTLAKYNSELLCLAGTLSRIIYENEMNQITRLYDEMIYDNTNNENDENTKSFRKCIERRAAHALAHFTFKPSTPNVQVGRIAESQFFNCSKKKLYILSTNGVLPICNVRIPNAEMAGFIKKVPVVPKIVMEQCEPFFKKAKATKLIEELTLKDVLYELENRALSEDEMVELLKWWISYRSKGNVVSQSEFAQFKQHARIDVSFRSLNTIRYFLNPVIVPPDVDVPIDVLPYTISKNLKKQDLENWFGWSELSLANWAKFIVDKPNLEINPSFAKKIHQILARSLNPISQSDKETIRQLFICKKCIPTKYGMRFPSESYFQNVNLFSDLPTIQFPKPLNVHNIMELLGVRKVVELKLIFDRLVGQGNWDHMQVAKYLASKSGDLKENEKKILMETPIWPRENSQFKNSDSTEQPVIQRYIASELYTPLPLHREFGLPVLDWKGKWAHYTQEGRFLIELGLQEYPALQKILQLAAPPTDHKIRNKALKYFINNFEEKYSKNYNPAWINIAFLPCSDQNYYTPSECFINPECTIMKFQTIRQDLRFEVERFGVCQHPNRKKLLDRLIEDPPRFANKAKQIFEYLASQQTEFIDADWDILSDLKFIPIRDKKRHNLIILANPRSCFFKVQEESLKDFFSCVDFGERANKFLQSCGVKSEPSPIDFAELLVKSSRDLLNSIGNDVEKYKFILRRIALDFKLIERSSIISEMSKAPILLAMRDNNYCLASAKEIFINDNTLYQQIFNRLIAPEDDYFMRILYKALGCRSLQETVQEIVKPMGATRVTESSQEIQQAIIERASLFYFQIPENRVKNDENWVKRLQVREIDYMETTYILETITLVRSRFTTACILKDQWSTDSWTLYVTRESETLDISEHIVKNIFTSHEWKDIFCLNVLLTAQLSSLERKGYPVEHILRQHYYNRYIDKYQESLHESPIVVTPHTTKILRNALRNAIKTCNYNLGDTFDNIINSQAGITIVNESQTSYCDIIPGHLLQCVGNIQEVKVYDTKDAYHSKILSQFNNSLHHFVNILKDLADVFELVLQAINIFYDNNSNSIAFNRDGVLFFNLKFYLGLHDQECKFKPTINVMTYWFMTFCHELAHNFIQQHSSDHEFYFSSYAENYMSNFLSVMINREIL